LYKTRDHAKAGPAELDREELASVAAKGREVAGSLDEEGARLTVSLNAERERHSRLADEPRDEAQRLRRQRRRMMSPRRRREMRDEAAERAARAADHWQQAREAHERLRELGNSGRHLHRWFERHEDVLARGLAAERALGAAHDAVYHVLGAPGIASHTAACLTSDRAIDIGRLERLVNDSGDARQRLLFQIAAELYDTEQGVSLNELLLELEGEDLDRVLQAIAMAKRRRLTLQGSAADLWIRAAEPEE
jgi:hypothetical protein